MKMDYHELKQFRKERRQEIKNGDVELLQRAVYGIATSGRYWGKTLRTALEEFGLVRC